MYWPLSTKTEKLAENQEVKLLTEYLSDVRGITPLLCICRDALQLMLHNAAQRNFFYNQICH